jgi:hypothetical protein
METTADLCEPQIPWVFGGWVDQWTYKEPGTWRGTEWPCPGRWTLAVLPESGVVVCTCGCHRGEFDHALPEHSAPRTAVHPTEVRA